MIYNTFPNITTEGLDRIRRAVEGIASNESVKYTLPDGTKVYKVPSNNPSKFTIRIDMKVEE